MQLFWSNFNYILNSALKTSNFSPKLEKATDLPQSSAQCFKLHKSIKKCELYVL